MSDIEINGTDPSTYGFTAMEADGLLSTPTLSFEHHTLPDRAGARVGLTRTATRPFQVRGLLESTSLDAARAALDGLNTLVLAAQPSTLVFAWSTTRRLSARCLGVQVNALGTLFGVLRHDVRLLFEAPDPPFFEGTSEHAVGSIQSTGKSLPAGNAPFFPLIAVEGPSSQIEVTLLDSTGGEVASMLFSTDLLLTSTETLFIDLDRQTVYVDDSTTPGSTDAESMIAELSSGDFFGVLPEYADVASSSFAVLCVDSGTSSGAVATAIYRKAWY